MVKIKLPQGENRDPQAMVLLEKERSRVKQFFDTFDIATKEKSIVFMYLEGNYSHIERKLLVAGVFINNTGQAVEGIKAKLRMKFINEPKGQIATMNFDIPPEVTGILEHGEGLLIHVSIPVRGLAADRVVQSGELEKQLSDVQAIASPGI